MNLGPDQLVIGKIYKSTDLSGEELAIISERFPSINLSRCISYNRLLISGVLYTSTSYTLATTKCDYLISFKVGSSRAIASVEKYLSFCYESCQKCSDFSYCQHIVLAKHHRILHTIGHHIHCITNSIER